MKQTLFFTTEASSSYFERMKNFDQFISYCPLVIFKVEALTRLFGYLFVRQNSCHRPSEVKEAFQHTKTGIPFCGAVSDEFSMCYLHLVTPSLQCFSSNNMVMKTTNKLSCNCKQSAHNSNIKPTR